MVITEVPAEENRVSIEAGNVSFKERLAVPIQRNDQTARGYTPRDLQLLLWELFHIELEDTAAFCARYESARQVFKTGDIPVDPDEYNHLGQDSLSFRRSINRA